jgi:hypothetical protein
MSNNSTSRITSLICAAIVGGVVSQAITLFVQFHSAAKGNAEQYELIPTTDSSDNQKALEDQLNSAAASGWKVKTSVLLTFSGKTSSYVILSK